jgi:cytochrome oxidase Cu insertion factor (SCO1/SenC/PrrC family)
MKAPLASRHMFGSGMLVLILAGILGAALWIWQDHRLDFLNRGERDLEGLQVFGTLPDFSLIERSGRRVTLSDLQGKVWIANFIYTHCTDTCPLQSARLAKLQDDFAGEGDLRLVSITVDPVRDTPGTLAEYAARFGADSERWLFLTGEKQAIYALAQGGFHLSVEEPEKPPAPHPRGPGRPGRLAGDPPRLADRGGWPEETPGGIFDWVIRAGFEPRLALAHSDFLEPPFLHSSWFVLIDRQVRIRGYYRSDDEEALRRLRRDTKTLLQEAGA